MYTVRGRYSYRLIRQKSADWQRSQGIRPMQWTWQPTPIFRRSLQSARPVLSKSMIRAWCMSSTTPGQTRIG